MALSDETKQSIERIVGLPFEDIIKMDSLHEWDTIEIYLDIEKCMKLAMIHE